MGWTCRLIAENKKVLTISDIGFLISHKNVMMKKYTNLIISFTRNIWEILFIPIDKEIFGKDFGR